MPMRPLIAPTTLAVLLATVALAGAATRAVAGDAPGAAGGPNEGDPVFVLTGSGNGHGVGLSQYGAFAQARAGRSAADILSFYFPGTTLDHRPSVKLRVLLVAKSPSLTLSADAPFSVRDASGQTHVLPAGALTLGPDLKVPVDGVETALPGPLTFTARTAFLSLGQRPYRGKIEVSSTGSALQAIDEVGLEAYLLGVVPGEMPSSWPEAALESQAIAARSYALATLVQGKPWTLYPDGRSQLYLGVAAETPETTTAVRATAGSVLVYDGAVATAFYSSSSGGRTQSGLDAFGLDLPYLPEQPDPWDASSPYHAWPPRSFTGTQLASSVGLDSPVVDVETRFSSSSRVVSITFGAADGSSVVLAGADARKRLKLRSTAFHLGELRFLTPPSAMAPRAALRLIGVARDADRAALERLAPDGSWQPVARRLRVSATGTFGLVVHPTQTTTYRLSAAGLAGPELTIPVVGTQS